MPLNHASSIKRPDPADVFLARTRASDWEWAQQALAMGFHPLSALTSKTSWAVAAARYDHKHGARIALHLVGGLLNTLNTSTQRDAIDALTELGTGLTGAIEHGNLAFLVGLAPAFEALPVMVRVRTAQFLGHHCTLDAPLPFGQIVWSEVLALSQAGGPAEKGKNKARKDWSWTRELPWESPLVTVDGTLTDLWEVVKNARAAHATTESMMTHLVDRLGDQVTAQVVDRAFHQGRWQASNQWSVGTTIVLSDVANLLGRLPVAPGSVGASGREMIDEIRNWADGLGAPQGAALRESGQRWETAQLHRLADQNATPGEARSRPRL